MGLQHTLARLSALELSPNERLAVDSFLERYKPTTKDLYACDLIIFITWCQASVRIGSVYADAEIYKIVPDEVGRDRNEPYVACAVEQVKSRRCVYE